MKKIFSFLAVAMLALTAYATDYYLVGTAPGWNQDRESNKFVDVNGVLTYTIADLYGDIKVTVDGQWHPQYGAVLDGDNAAPLKFNTPYVLGGEGSDGEAINLPIELEENYRYKDAKLTLKVEGDKLTLTLVEGTLYDHSAVGPTYQLVGACTDNWSLVAAIQFEDVNGVLTANVPDLNGTFKIVQDRSWDNQWATKWGTKDGLKLNEPYEMGAKGAEGTSGDPANLALANPFGGYKNAVLTLSVGEKMVLTLTAGEFYISQNDWFIPGSKLGWDCKDAQKFTPVAGKQNTYEYLAPEFGQDFKVVYGNWAVEFGANNTDDKWEINKSYTMTYPCAGNFYPASKEIYQDVTITIVVDYEKAEVQFIAETEATGVEDIKTQTQAVKRIENGQLIILKNGIRYNVLGAEIK